MSTSITSEWLTRIAREEAENEGPIPVQAGRPSGRPRTYRADEVRWTPEELECRRRAIDRLDRAGLPVAIAQLG